MQKNRRDPHSGVWTMLSTPRSHAHGINISMMANADIASLHSGTSSPREVHFRLKRVTSTNRCEVFLLNHKAALEPSDPVALTETHATRMVPGAHNAPSGSSRQDATVGVRVRLHGPAMDPHRFWASRGSLQLAARSTGPTPLSFQVTGRERTYALTRHPRPPLSF